MESQEYQELIRQIAELRRETRILRHWLAFTGAGVAILLFLPQGAAILASGSLRTINFAVENLGSLAATFVVIVMAALFISGQDRTHRRRRMRRERQRRREPLVHP